MLSLKHIITLLLLSISAWAGTCGNGYKVRMLVTINHLKVSNTNQTDFPFRIYGTYGWAKQVPNAAGQIINTTTLTNGDTGPADLVVCDAASAGNSLSHEIVKWNASTGELFMVVKVPTVSVSNDTLIYIFVGNSSVTTNQENVSDTWSNSYLQVCHLSNGSSIKNCVLTGTVTNHGATASTSTFGVGATFVRASSQWIDTGAKHDSLNAFTLEAYVGPPPSSGTPDWEVGSWDGSNGISLNSGDTGATAILCQMSNGGLNTTKNQAFGNSSRNLHTCTHAASSSSLTLYYDGLTGGSIIFQNNNASTPGNSSNNLKLGQRGNETSYWNSSLNEISLSSVARTQDWTRTEYNNMCLLDTDPGTCNTITGKFYTIDQGTIASVTYSPSACPTGYSHLRKIVITTHPSSTVTNFPFLLKGTTFTFWKTIANGGEIQNTTTGYTGFTIPADLVFCDTPVGNRLYHEVDHYSVSSGTMGFWILLPSVSNSVDTVFYALSGKVSQTTSQETLPDLWNLASFISVYHFGNGSSLVLKDSGPGHNDLTAIGAAATTGQISGGVIMNAGTSGSAKVLFPTGFPQGTSARTIEAWAQETGGQANNPKFIAGYGQYQCGIFSCSPTGTTFGFQVDNAGGSPVKLGVVDTPYAFSITNGSGAYCNPACFTNSGNYSKWVATSAASNSAIGSAKLFQNGIQLSTTTPYGTDSINTTYDSSQLFTSGQWSLRIGACLGGGDQGATSCFYGGGVDELRVSVSDLSAVAGWLPWEYTNDTTTTFTVTEVPQAKATVRIIR